MFMKICFVFVLGCLSVANAQNQFCTGGVCFIRPEPTSRKTWMDAQQMCRNNNSTLPIADNSSRWQSFVDALRHFQLNDIDVWLGANASDNGSNNWKWLDGRQYTGPDVQQRGEYYKSYAIVASTSTGVLAYAHPPNVSYPYICQSNAINPGPDVCRNETGRIAFVKENRCYLKYDENLPWFSARNKCLENKCDLASFSLLSLLDGKADTSGCWVGLRHSQWNWQNAVTGLSSDVTFSSWAIGQPNDAVPHCMATASGDFPNWKDIDCTQVYSYICQVSDISSFRTPYSSSTATTTTSTSSTSTTTSTTTRTSPLGTPGTAETSTSATASRPLSSAPNISTPNADNMNSTNAGSVNVALAVGLGVGLGVPFIILIVAVIVVVAVILPRKHRNSGEIRNARSTKKFVTNSGQENTDNGTTETTDKKKKGKTPPDSASAQYATIREANRDANLVPPSNEGTVYAGLRFDQEDS